MRHTHNPLYLTAFSIGKKHLPAVLSFQGNVLNLRTHNGNREAHVPACQEVWFHLRESIVQQNSMIPPVIRIIESHGNEEGAVPLCGGKSSRPASTVPPVRRMAATSVSST